MSSFCRVASLSFVRAMIVVCRWSFVARMFLPDCTRAGEKVGPKDCRPQWD
jgi:hypothetical protein